MPRKPKLVPLPIRRLHKQIQFMSEELCRLRCDLTSERMRTSKLADSLVNVTNQNRELLGQYKTLLEEKLSAQWTPNRPFTRQPQTELEQIPKKYRLTKDRGVADGILS